MKIYNICQLMNIVNYLFTMFIIDDNQVKINSDKKIVQKANYTPIGFWVYSSEEYKLLSPSTDTSYYFAVEFEYTTKKDPDKILQISTASQLDKFTFKYGIRDDTSKTMSVQIDWARVAHDYGGIQIFPKIIERSGLIHDKKVVEKYQKHGYAIDKKYLWYNLWNYATGCIWNPLVIKDGKLVEKNRL